jgi:hypothetical protein
MTLLHYPVWEGKMVAIEVRQVDWPPAMVYGNRGYPGGGHGLAWGI